MNALIQDDWHEWFEVTTAPELSEGRRTFIKGRAKYPPVTITPAAIEAFTRFGTDAYDQVVDYEAGLRAFLEALGIPVAPKGT